MLIRNLLGMGVAAIPRSPPNLRIRLTSAPRREHEAHLCDFVACTHGENVLYVRETGLDSLVPQPTHIRHQTNAERPRPPPHHTSVGSA